MAGHPTLDYADANAIKANFDQIYHQPDPRAYYAVLGGLDYVIPEVARPAFLQLADRLIEDLGRPITILDIGCSYGVNAALMRHGVNLAQLRERYLSPSLDGIGGARLAELDSRYFLSWPTRKDIRFVGLDCEKDAIGYAIQAGLLDAGLTANLEIDAAPRALEALVRDVDLVISTGAVGYVTEKTFEKILNAMPDGRTPWFASFVLRMFEYDKITAMLEDHGLGTEKFPGATFVQRRFKDRAEFEHVMSVLKALGIDATGKEAEGLFHAELFVSRQPEAIAAEPLTEIVSLTSGGARQFGDRHRRGRAQSQIALSA